MSFFSTDTRNYSLTILRLTLAAFIIPHGLQKALGMFGGPGYEGAMGFLTGMGVPSFVAMLVIVGESLGGLGILLGFLTRLCAAGVAIIMLGAIALVHAPNGFFAPGGFEMHLLAIGIAVVLAIWGGGAWSVDGLLGRRRM